MSGLTKYIPINDTIPVQELQLKLPAQQNTLSIERNSIELVDLRQIQVDSTRIQPKKIIPVVKTIPYVPVSDSIAQPEFNVFTGYFDFPERQTLWDRFAFDPINPALASEFQFMEFNKPTISDKLVTTKQPVSSEQVIAIHAKTTVKSFENTDWMLGIIIFSLIVFAWIRFGFSRYVQNVIQASYNFFSARRIQEESNALRSRVFYFMNFLFFINISLFSAQYLEFKHISIFNQHGFVLFLLSFLVWLIIYGLKGFFLFTLDFLFLAKGKFMTYNSTVFIYNKLFGFFLLPVVAVLPYIPVYTVLWLFKITAIVFIFLYIFRIFRGLQIGIKNRLSIFYLILYLCALEILPMMLLYKAITLYI